MLGALFMTFQSGKVLEAFPTHGADWKEKKRKTRARSIGEPISSRLHSTM